MFAACLLVVFGMEENLISVIIYHPLLFQYYLRLRAVFYYIVPLYPGFLTKLPPNTQANAMAVLLISEFPD